MALRKPASRRPAPRRKRPLRLALVGFGSVGRRFAERLLGVYGRELRKLGFEPRVTGIATARHGLAVAEQGLPLRRALALLAAGRSLVELQHGRAPANTLDFVRQVPADVVFEISPLVPQTGQPALAHARAALRRGIHVVTANKGPVAHARRALLRLASRHGVAFRHEGVVMDGMPIFNLVERCLPGATILGFRGLLNSTTTRVLSGMEAGASFEAALGQAQAAGVAEADPRNDLEGWDAAVKACTLANGLMGANLRPQDVQRRGIVGTTPADVRAALDAGRRLRLIVRAARVGRGVRVSVAPEAVPADDLLVSRDADGVLVLETDLMGEVGLWEGKGGVDQTAYALFADLVAVISDRRESQG